MLTKEDETVRDTGSETRLTLPLILVGGAEFGNRESWRINSINYILVVDYSPPWPTPSDPPFVVDVHTLSPTLPRPRSDSRGDVRTLRDRRGGFGWWG